MKTTVYIFLFLLILVLVNNSEARGSPAANIAGYITRLKEMKRRRELRARHNSRATVRRKVLINCDGFYCRN